MASCFAGASELQLLFKSIGSKISYEDMVAIMQRFDKDENGQIEFREFLLMFREKLLDLKVRTSCSGRNGPDCPKSSIIE